MLAKFSIEHRHDEDEVRFIVEGRGLFHIHPHVIARRRARSRSGRLDSRAARHAALVRLVRRTANSRDSIVSRHVRLDAALHQQRNRSRLRAGVLGTALHPPQPPRRRRRSSSWHARNGTTSASCFWILKARPHRSTSSTKLCFRTPAATSNRFWRRDQEPEIRSTCAGFEGASSEGRRGRACALRLGRAIREDELRDCVAYVQWLIARDSKCTPLKTLQGKIWQQGFESGELHGEVYPDVPPAFARWRRQGREICIYSSGSVLAQRLLFGTVISGDLTRDISRCFSTPDVGARPTPGSYSESPRALRPPPSKVLFLSDAPKEIDAARVAGMQAALCERPALSNSSQSDGAIRDFDEILPD